MVIKSAIFNEQPLEIFKFFHILNFKFTLVNYFMYMKQTKGKLIHIISFYTYNNPSDYNPLPLILLSVFFFI